MFYLVKFDDGVCDVIIEKSICKRFEDNKCIVRTKWGFYRAQILGQHESKMVLHDLAENMHLGYPKISCVRIKDSQLTETNTCNEQNESKMLALTTAWIRTCDPEFDNKNESITESSNTCSEGSHAVSDVLTGAESKDDRVTDKNRISEIKLDEADSSKVEENCETSISSSVKQKHAGEYDSPGQSTDGGNAGADCLSDNHMNLKSIRNASFAITDKLKIKVATFEDVYERSGKTSHINAKVQKLGNENESVTESPNVSLKGLLAISDVLTGAQSTDGIDADKKCTFEKKLDEMDSSKVEENCEARMCNAADRKDINEYESTEQSADSGAADNRSAEVIRISSFIENQELSFIYASNTDSGPFGTDSDILFDGYLTDCDESRLIIDEGGENVIVTDDGTKIAKTPHNESGVPKVLLNTVISPGFEKTNLGFNIYMSRTVGKHNFSNFKDAEVAELYSNEDAIVEPEVEEEADTSVDKDYLPAESEYYSMSSGTGDDEEAVANASEANISQKSQQNSSAELSTSFSSVFVRRNKSSLPAENLSVEVAKDGKGSGKRHFCYYCKKLQTQIARHLQQVHSDEELVKKLIHLPPKSREKKDAIGIIRKKGDFLYNTDKDYKTGSIIPMRRPSTQYERKGADFMNDL